MEMARGRLRVPILVAWISLSCGLAAAAPTTAGVTVGASCAFDPSTRTLAVSGAADAAPITLIRGGEAIRLADSFGKVTPCDGPVPTVDTVDTIRIDASSFITVVTIDLTNGPFAPGATDEGDGASEIEIEGSLGVEPIIEITGSAKDERFSVGRVPGSDGAVNLNAAESHPDADFIFSARNEQIQLDAGPGDDRYSASSRDGFVRAYRTIAVADGGDGRDHLIGGPARDILDGGRGHDVLPGLGGRDFLNAHDFAAAPPFGQFPARDVVACGPARDVARVDHLDRASACERLD